MTLAIVRPSPDSEQLAQQLASAGIPARAEPIMGTQVGQGEDTLVSQLQQLQPDDIVIAVSKNAVTFAAKIMTAHKENWPKTVHYMAVGASSAALFTTETGQKVTFPQQADSEGLLALTALQQVGGRQVLILRGQDGRETLYRTLQQRGAQVSYCETYQRQWLVDDSHAFFQRWYPDTSGIVVTSQAQLDKLWQWLAPQDITWLRSLPVWVPSQRIATRAQTLGFRTVFTVNSASNCALFATLSLISRTGQTDD
ncbi:uroporphyrinogen-III synthase [Thaumasiovibrio sp. DFM-14]|uniref:uroporphyrinogen-III synthase n=1 Tax=Thaumasiovibrio sp. DFM-14 TaxID=3384792 RepID=UPI0039A232FB